MRETSSPPSEMCFMVMWLRCLNGWSGCLLRASGDARFDVVVCQRGRQLPEGVDLPLKLGYLLLGLRDRVGAGDEAPRRLLLLGDGQQRPGELGRVAGLL